MVKFSRVTQKVFAQDSQPTDTAVFGTMRTSPQYTSDIETLMSSPEFLQGWQDAVVSGFAPFMEELTGMQKVITTQLAYLLQTGIADWDAETDYYLGNVVRVFKEDTGGITLYLCAKDGSIGVNPTTSGQTDWKSFFDSDEPYAYDNAVVHKAGAEIITGLKTFAIPSGGQNWSTVSNPNIDITVTPTSSLVSSQNFTDVNARTLSTNGVYQQQTDNAIINRDTVYNANGDTAYLQVQIQPNGVYTANVNGSVDYLPPSADNSSTIATTRWLNTAAGARISYMSIDRSLQINGFVKFRNNILFQWGRSDIDISGTTVAFPVAFQNGQVAMSIVKVVNDAGATAQANIIRTTTTSFTATVSGGVGTALWTAMGF